MKAFSQFVVLPLSTFCGFSILPLPLATLLIIVSSSSMPLWEFEIKKCACHGLIFREILIHRHWCQEVPIGLWFQEVRVAGCLWTFMSLNLAFDFVRNTTTLSKFYGVNRFDWFLSISFFQLSKNIPGIMTKESMLWNFDIYFDICPMVSIYAIWPTYF